MSYAGHLLGLGFWPFFGAKARRDSSARRLRVTGVLENSPVNTTQLPTGCQPESLPKPARRRSHKATQPQLLTRRASSTILRLGQKTSQACRRRLRRLRPARIDRAQRSGNYGDRQRELCAIALKRCQSKPSHEERAIEGPHHTDTLCSVGSPKL